MMTITGHLLRTTVATLFLASFLVTEAKVTHLLPTPKEVTLLRCTVAFPKTFMLTADASPRLVAAFAELMGTAPSPTEGLPVSIATGASIEGAYDYKLEGYDDEAYELSVGTEGIGIRAATETGVIRAFATLAQLCEDDDGRTVSQVQCCRVKDWPSFKLRGYMHDVGRSFISFDELMKELRLMARFKVNTFHWHLTENQAWRFEVLQYPQLTAESTMTRYAGCYYTQQQCRQLDSLAWLLGINVIPEIDMPGHSEAFQRAMGHSMQTSQGVTELKNILGEVASVFVHAPYIHIGADETRITYSNFLRIITNHIHGLGKKVVVWNPIQGVTLTAQTGADMTQMWSAAGKTVSGLPNIDCRYNYVNHFDVFADLAGIYRSNIYYQPQGNSQVAGTITAVWNDTYLTSEEAIIRQNNFYANTLASAERAWKGGGKQYIDQGGAILPPEGDETDEFRDWERRFLFHKDHVLAAEPIPYVRQTDIVWMISDAFPNGGNASASFPPEQEGPQQSYTYNGQTYNTALARGGGIYLRHVWGTLVPAFYANSQLNHTAYAWTWVWSPADQEAGALIELQNYSRSEHDAAPDNGQWDRRGSRIWLNDEEISGPQWDNAGKTMGKESPLGNENFTAREPVRVQLRQGWNKIFLKLPYVDTPGIRLNKWMFTFVLTDLEGRNALDGIIYSATAAPPSSIQPITVSRSTPTFDLLGRATATGQSPITIAEGKKIMNK